MNRGGVIAGVAGVAAHRGSFSYGAMSGDHTTKGDEDEGVEPDELGTKTVEHGACVSMANSSQFRVVSTLEAILYCRSGQSF